MQTAVASPRIDLALTVLRAVAGIVFAAHGAQKLFVYGIAGVTGSFAEMGLPMATLLAPAVALTEFLGGLALVAGLFTRLASLGLAAVMLGALLLVHLPNGFFSPGGIEFSLTLLAASVALALSGAGRFSLDHMIAARRATR